MKTVEFIRPITRVAESVSWASDIETISAIDVQKRIWWNYTGGFITRAETIRALMIVFNWGPTKAKAWLCETPAYRRGQDKRSKPVRVAKTKS